MWREVMMGERIHVHDVRKHSVLETAVEFIDLQLMTQY